MRPPARRTARALAAVAAIAVLFAIAATPAHGARNLVSVFQDDRVLTREGPERRDAALDEMKLLGVDVIRTIVNWERVAPAARDRTVPEGLDLTSPAAYSPDAWDPFDELVRAAHARGMEVLMNPAGAIPDWASGCDVNTYRVCLPNATLFGQFVTAVARRYSGIYPDENGGGELLPRITKWSLWNEGNIISWIAPQVMGTGKKRRRVAAKIYRGLMHAGIDALRANGHADDTILLGETAPLGAPPTRTSPVQFYRDLFCIDARGRKLRGRAAKLIGCVKPRPFDVQGLAHHPYVKGAGPPIPTRELKGAASVGTMGELKRVIRQGAARGMIRRKLPMWVTEFGISTNPPDKKYGVKLSTAAAYLNQVDRYLHMDKDIVSTHQFEYEDDTGLATLTFQTGLRFGDGTAKPGLTSYRFPVHVTRSGSKNVNVWGWVRAADKGVQTVVIQSRRSSSSDWVNVRTVRTDAYGFLNVRTKRRAGTWRLAWGAPSGEIVVSREARVDRFDRAPSPGPSPSGPAPPPDPVPNPVPDPTNPNPDPTNPVPDPTNPSPDPDPPPPPPNLRSLEVKFVRTKTSPVATSVGSGTITATPPGESFTSDHSRAYTQGTQVQLSAQPASPNNEFVQWTGACTGTVPTCTVQMSQARQVTAEFRYTGVVG